MKKIIIFALCLVLFRVFAEQFDWSKAKQIAPGILHTSVTVQKPRLIIINAVRIDLKTDGLYFMSTPRSDNWGKTLKDAKKEYIARTKRETSMEFFEKSRAAGHNMLVAVNTSGWLPWEFPWTHTYAGNLGLTVSGGVPVDYPNGNPSFVVYKDGTCDFISAKRNQDISNIHTAVSGFSFVLKDGKNVARKQKNESLAPRTGYGLSKDHRYLYLLTADGRRPAVTEGMSVREVGDFLSYYGAYSGLNMDGGYSTTLIALVDGKPERLNSALAYRKIACTLGICVRKPEK